MRTPAATFPLLLACAVAAPASHAESLALNGDFREGLSSWSRVESVTWDERGATGPGSARLRFPTRPEGGDAMIQCVAVEGFRLYDLAAAGLLPRDPAASGGLSVRIQWHPEPGCQGPRLRGAPSVDLGPGAGDGWQLAERRRIPAPAPARSALLVVVAHAAGARPYEMLLDDVVLRRSVEVEDVVLPTAASLGGARGERFETDLWVHNPAPAERMFALRFRQEGPASTPVVLRVGPGATRHLADVLGAAFGLRERAGALQLSYDPREGPMLFAARVVTVDPTSPGNGTALPVLPSSAARTAALFPGLSGERGDATGAFRVNAGAFNPHDVPVAVTFRLVDGDGTELGTVSRTLAAGAWQQVNDVVREAGAEGISTEGAFVVFSSPLPLFPFVIAVDNRSGDGTFVPAQDVPE